MMYALAIGIVVYHFVLVVLFAVITNKPINIPHPDIHSDHPDPSTRKKSHASASPSLDASL